MDYLKGKKDYAQEFKDAFINSGFKKNLVKLSWIGINIQKKMQIWIMQRLFLVHL